MYELLFSSENMVYLSTLFYILDFITKIKITTIFVQLYE
jgi:hypothetical protein